MKIGIVTYWKSSCNYGEQLQNYALQEYLRKLGHEPFLIRYDYDGDRISRPLSKKIMKVLDPRQMRSYLRTVRNGRRLIRDGMEHPRGFEGFRERNLAMSRLYSSIDDLRHDPPEADAYITGSDQVWNTFEGGLAEMRNRVHAFFLDFGSEDKIRMSYAASWGRGTIPEEEKEVIKPLLSRFDAISVRETPGIDICRGIGRDDAFLAPDPVLLFDADKYRELYSGNNKIMPEDKYLFFYYMNHDGNYNRQAVFDWAKTKGLKVVYVTDDWNDDHERSFPSVSEWIELIDNAEYVVTNSYHCSLFSIIFGKRFGVIKRFGAYQGMNTRMDSVFDLCGITPRYIGNDGFDVLEDPSECLNINKISSACTPDKVIEAAVMHRKGK